MDPDEEVRLWCARTLDPEKVRRWRRDEQISAVLGEVIRIGWWLVVIGGTYAVVRSIWQLMG